MSMDDPHKKEIADLQRRLAELDRERASLLTALEKLQSRRKTEAPPTPPLQTVGDIATIAALSNVEKIAFISIALPRSRRCLRSQMGKFKDWKGGLRSCVPQRMGSRYLREAADQMQ
jgi:hypothetical protein